MATKKKGCGFLIVALVLLILGGLIAAILGKSAYSTGKEFAEDIKKGEIFVTPATLDYTSDVNGEVTVWLTSDTPPPTDTIEIEITDTASGKSSMADKPSSTSSMNNQHLVATFSVAKGSSYKVRANSTTAGQTLRVSSVDSAAVLSMLGKGFGAFGVFGICAFLALIFGIIGLVKFFGSKNASSVPPPM